MRIMTILGSPRRQGNTAKVLSWIEEQAQTDGHELDRANILDYNVAGCRECLACKKGTLELCSIDDDANALFRRMVASDLVLLAAPIFCWGFPAQIKCLIDRTFCMMDFDGERSDVPRLYGKPMALLLTGGGEERNNADLVIAGFKNLVEYLRGKLAGHLYVTIISGDTAAIGGDITELAVKFANVITDKTG
jgi:multimeric flavodoxin WrbA